MNTEHGFSDPSSEILSCTIGAQVDNSCSPYTRCKLRTCPRCAETKAQRITDNIQKRLDSGRTYYHVTLTVADHGQPLRRQLSQLFDSFRTLKRRRQWTTSIVGGIYTVDVTYNGSDWNAHLHILAEGDGLSTDDLSRLWLSISGASVVDIRELGSESYRNNVARYVAKPPQLDLFAKPEALAEFNAVTNGMRLKRTFGNQYGTPLLAKRGKSIAA